MAVLRLHLDGRTDMSPGAPVVTSVLDEDLDAVAEVPVPIGGTREVEVAGGSYVVRATPPGGSALSARVSVAGDEEKDVALGHLPTPHEHLEWHTVLGHVAAGPAGRATLGEPHALASVWLRVWRRDADETWRVEQLSWSTSWDGEYGTARASGLEPAQRVLQLGGEQVPWRLIALPATDRLEVLLQSDPLAPELDAGVDVSVVTGETRGQMLQRYRSRGRIDAARVVADELSGDPAPTELADPASALTLGYYLLEIGDLDRLDARVGRLADRFPWLPDSLIIEGWRALRGGDVESGRARLLEAASRGVPLYAEGLRLLSLGLRLLESHDGRGGTRDGELTRAVERMGPLAAAMNWTEAFSSYYGPHPTAPTLTPPVGIPEGPLTWIGPEPVAPGPEPRPRPRWPRWLLAGGVVAAAAIGVWLATRGGGPSAPVAEPDPLSFAEQPVGTSVERALTISNPGTVPLQLRRARPRGSAAEDYDVATDTCAGAELPSDRSCSLVIVFTPSAEGERNAHLVIRHDGPGRPLRVPLRGVGGSADPGGEETVAPLIEVEPTSITFPADVPREGAVEPLTIRNPGDAVLELDALVEPEQEGFVIDPATLEDCRQIEPAGSCTLSIGYVPVAGSRGEANVIVETNATPEPLQVPVAGTPRAAVSPTDIGPENWGDGEATVVVANTGTRVVVPALGISGDERFAIVDHDCGEIAIREDCSITVAFDSANAPSGAYSAVLNVDDGGGQGPQTVALAFSVPDVVD